MGAAYIGVMLAMAGVSLLNLLVCKTASIHV